MNSELLQSKGEYRKQLQTFEHLITCAVRVSDASGGIHTSNLGIEATKIYTRITLSAMTIGSILPTNQVNKTKLWDFPSVASLGRAFMETCHRYLYLCEDALSEDEAEFRLKLFFYHMNCEKYRLYKDFEAKPEVLADFEEKIPQAKVALIASTIYKTLPSHMAEKVRRGNTEMHISDEVVANKHALIGGRFKPIYRLLSNYAHGAPFATYSQSNTRGRGFANVAEIQYIELIVRLLNHYLSVAILNQVRLLNMHDTQKKEVAYATSVRCGWE